MDIQSRKLEFIQEFLKVKNEELISRLEKLLKTNNEDEFISFTIDEFNSRIDESMQDSKNESIIESNELLSEIKQWQ
ncbi:hypothetical protein [Chryseobacterium sp. GP-SGM7]|uniref:hypothetical protein n=1 Tax=Chryseobacterium sp. GP-SGM7 TaxID=3411323 RepID=UPI003B924C8A